MNRGIWMTILFASVFILSGLLPPALFGQGVSDDDWYVNSYRKLFFDFHTQKTAVEVAEGFDADRWADELKRAHVQVISLHSNCNYGWKYYRKGKFGYVHPQLPAGLDIIEEMTRACHERGIKVIGYFNVLNSEPIAELHPDWLLQDKDGNVKGTTISLMSPYFEEVLLPQLEEYTRNYDVDGVFFDFLYARVSFDTYSREKFKEAFGKELPEDSSNPDYALYVKWMLDEHRKMRRMAYDAVHRGRARTLTSVNWAYTYRQPEVPPEGAGFLSLDILPQDQVFDGSYVAKNWVTLNKPFDIMNSAFLRWWGDWGVKPAETLMQECAASIANGGRTWIGYQYNAHYAVEPALMEEYRKTFEFVMAREDFCNGAVPVPYIAVLHSTHGHFTHGPTLNVDETRLRALFKMMLESGFHFNILDEKTLLKNLDRYKLVILPDQRYLEPELVSALKTFVRNGGGLISTVLTGTQDASYRPSGKFALEDVLGVRLENGKYPHDHSYITAKDDRLKKDVLDMPQEAYGEVVYSKPEGARILAELWDVYTRGDGGYLPWTASPPGKYTGYPAVTIHEYGAGKAVYIAQDIFKAYSERIQWNLKNMFRNIINITIPEKLVEIDAPGMVEVVLNRKENDLLVNLVNHYRDKRIGNSISIAEHVVPVHDITVKLRVDKSPASVTLIPGGRNLAWEEKDGYITFTVPKLHIHAIAVVKQ